MSAIVSCFKAKRDGYEDSRDKYINERYLFRSQSTYPLSLRYLPSLTRENSCPKIQLPLYCFSSLSPPPSSSPLSLFSSPASISILYCFLLLVLKDGCRGYYWQAQEWRY